jgi:hypothetical protein
MRRDIIRYGFISMIIIVILIFGYPTLYKYDKLDQKWPVKINRITGKTQILYGLSWTTVEDNEQSAPSPEKKLGVVPSSPTPIAEETFNGETFDQFYERVINELRPDQVPPSKSHLYIDFSRASLGLDDKIIEPKDYFTIGSTKAEVLFAMDDGPDNRKDYGDGNETWYYKGSSISFTDGKVTDYNNISSMNVR